MGGINHTIILYNNTLYVHYFPKIQVYTYALQIFGCSNGYRTENSCSATHPFMIFFIMVIFLGSILMTTHFQDRYNKKKSNNTLNEQENDLDKKMSVPFCSSRRLFCSRIAESSALSYTTENQKIH